MLATGFNPGSRAVIGSDAYFLKLPNIGECVQGSIERQIRPRGWNPNKEERKKGVLSTHTTMVAPA